MRGRARRESHVLANVATKTTSEQIADEALAIPGFAKPFANEVGQAIVIRIGDADNFIVFQPWSRRTAAIFDLFFQHSNHSLNTLRIVCR